MSYADIILLLKKKLLLIKKLITLKINVFKLIYLKRLILNKDSQSRK